MKIILALYLTTGFWQIKTISIEPVGIFDTVAECEAQAREFSDHRHICITEDNYKTLVETINNKE